MTLLPLDGFLLRFVVLSVALVALGCLVLAGLRLIW
jgi:hypothetical protein